MTGDWFHKKKDSKVYFLEKAFIWPFGAHTAEDWVWTGSWNQVKNFYKIVSQDKYSSYSVTITNKQELEETIDSEKISEGDIIFFHDSSEYAHTAVVSEIDHHNNILYFAAHTDNYKKQDISESLPKYAKITIFHTKDKIS